LFIYDLYISSERFKYSDKFKMCRSITTLVIAVCAGVASAATNCKQQPATGDPSGNPVYHPGLDEQVPVGAPFDITWNVIMPFSICIGQTLIGVPAHNDWHCIDCTSER